MTFHLRLMHLLFGPEYDEETKKALIKLKSGGKLDTN